MSNVCNGKQIVGRIEPVVLNENHLILNAKLDTGATMASLSAQDIQVFENNHVQWVRFTLNQTKIKHRVTLTKRLQGYAHILKREEEVSNDTESNANFSIRPVIKLSVKLNNQDEVIEVNLTDRTHFQYPLLLGIDALKKFNVMVDVSK